MGAAAPAGIGEAGPVVCRRRQPGGRYIRWRRPSWTSAASRREPGLAGKARRNMTAVNSTPGPDQDLDREPGTVGLAGLPGLQSVETAPIIGTMKKEGVWESPRARSEEKI